MFADDPGQMLAINNIDREHVDFESARQCWAGERQMILASSS